MIEDVYEPLAKYRDEFKDRFTALTVEKFNELVTASGIDVNANRAQVAKIKSLEGDASSARFRKRLFACLAALGFVLAAGVFLWLVLFDAKGTVETPHVLAIVGGIVFGVFMLPRYKAAAAKLRDLESCIAAAKKVAWEQMEPLNRLYTWDVTLKLIEATVPRLRFDPYFASARLDELRKSFDWDDSFNDGKSVLFAQSGVINGNPFVLGHCLDMEWGTKTYEGSKTISWTDWETGADGKRRRVRKYETLYASVTKPIPVYEEEKFLLYGNDAAGALSFSREPSGLTGCDGLWGTVRKKWRLSRLKSHSRDLTDDSDFTLMGNHEFETWFHAKNRDNEVEFRLLFTPVAQTQLLGLMKDTEVGYGDDFAFVKARKINLMFSKHLNEGVIDTNPSRFYHWDFDAAAKNFVSFNVQYFKDVYFAFAPLLCVPLYQQTRTHEDIWRGVIDTNRSSFWEHESLANYFGEDEFRHPDCVTRSILKTKVLSRGDGGDRVEVTAYGYSGEARVDYESVLGGDGEYHDVPVEWIEYLPVEKTREIRVTERADPHTSFVESYNGAARSVCRRSVYAFLR